jgi:hypothetical protein
LPVARATASADAHSDEQLASYDDGRVEVEERRGLVDPAERALQSIELVRNVTFRQISVHLDAAAHGAGLPQSGLKTVFIPGRRRRETV